jgi:hypothetical protein
MAAAPGHPYLAKALETVVNQVRNRFISVDVDAKFCPNPATSVLETSDLVFASTLFVSGPCLSGASINQVLRRNLQTQFETGDVWRLDAALYSSRRQWNVGEYPRPHSHTTSEQKDMGAQRFARRDLNRVADVTDMPNSNDLDHDAAKKKHYSEMHSRSNIYGLENVYRDQKQANVDILIKVIG